MYDKLYLERVDANKILNSNQLHIWWWLLGFVVDEKEHFCNPFREDSHPGCWLEWKGNYLRLQDYADRKYHGLNIFSATSMIYNIGFKESLHKIVNELDLNITTIQKAAPKKVKAKKLPCISIVTKGWDEIDKSFWKPILISNVELEEDKVLPISSYIVDGKLYKTDKPAYSYEQPSGRRKIYQPTGTMKWYSNCTIEDVGSYDKLPEKGDTLIITKSYKDCRILRNLGYYSIWLQNEGCTIPDHILKDLKSRFKNIYILFDNDKGGLKAASKLQELYGFKFLQFPSYLSSYIYEDYFLKIPKFSVTDVCELLSTHERDKTIEIIEESISKLRDT